LRLVHDSSFLAHDPRMRTTSEELELDDLDDEVRLSVWESCFFYVCIFAAFVFLALLRSQSVSETRKRVAEHLREVDVRVDEANYSSLLAVH